MADKLLPLQFCVQNAYMTDSSDDVNSSSIRETENEVTAFYMIAFCALI